ncbi:outer membrane protein TolC [Haloferula luteola]|uniref:Outer membrane protein TolC n=1 Tax=Haloferula luteola TaxID=595692 RepID=A0A840V7Q2_9BACT|nr:TolC family protein [Haloferula luteola]MBB5350768.1 outer membrane protein TolC [Haloferula luteola]
MVIRTLGGVPMVMALFVSCQAPREEILDPTATLAAYRRSSLHSPEAIASLRKAGESPGGTWTVRKMVAAVETTHPSLSRARAQLHAAQAGIDVAGTHPPVGISLDLQRALQGASPWTCGLMLDYTLETGGKRAARIVKARAEADRAAIAITQARGDIHSAVARAFIDHHAAAAQLAALEESSRDLDAWEQASTQLAKLGETDRLQSYTLERERSLLEREMATTRKQSRVADAALARALGIPFSEVAHLPLAPLPESLPAVPSRSAIQNTTALSKPEVLDPLAAYAIAEAALRIEVSQQYPDLHLGPGYSYDQGQQKWQLAASLAIPSDINAATIRRAEADRTAAAAVFVETQNTALGNSAAALEAYSGCLQQWRQATELVVKSEAIHRAQTQITRAGAGDRLPLLQAQYSTCQDRAAEIAARFDAWRAWVDLLDATRGPIAGNLL